MRSCQDAFLLWQVMERIHSQIQASTSEVAAVPLHGLSAKTGEGAQDLLPAAMQLYDTWNNRLTTSRLNAWKEKVTASMLTNCLYIGPAGLLAHALSMTLAHIACKCLTTCGSTMICCVLGTICVLSVLTKHKGHHAYSLYISNLACTT